MPLVNEYEQYNAKKFNGAKKGILQGKHGLSERDLIRRERKLINSYIQMPCKASTIPTRLGKVPNALKRSIYIEYDNYLEHISQYLPDPLHTNTDFVQYLKQNQKLLDEFADQFVLTLPSPRQEFYL